ncbi:MAG: asparagine synthase C-terminal domain-containing protein, partial [Bacteroidota bacterium]
IESVPPGQPLQFSFAGAVEKLPEVKSIFFTSSRKDNLESVILDAVQRRLLADVPVGTFLSGGLDSSLISAMARQFKPSLKTFSLGFEDSKFDESPFAEIVANHIKSDHTTFKISTELLVDAAKEFPKHIDQPFGDSSALATGLLCEQTSKHVKVALSGDGADELFAGYNKHRVFSLMQQPIKQLIPPPSLTKSIPGLSAELIKKMAKLHGLKQLNNQRVYDSMRAWVDDDLLSRWVDSYSPSNLPNVGNFEQQLLEDQNKVLQNDMLVKVDRMSMLHGLEVRVPFLDSEVVGHARSLKKRDLIDGRKTKLPLRNIALKWLPKEILNRPKKGFEVPLSGILRHGLKDEMEELLQHSDVSFMNLKQIKKDWEPFLANEKGNPYAFWFIYVLLSWKKYH